MTTLLAAILIAIFALLGIAKLAAVPAMRAAAGHLGYSVDQYRLIGALELAGAVGVAIGRAVAPLGIAAGIGLVMLMLGAAIAHVRNRDALSRLLVPLMVGAAAAAYVVTLAG